ncbi:MAG: hypothetical protein DRN91_09180 [Candidatus Alkanophagales archaeon]|nr:MAG: hypothetical protein DRN91_09180 [Candidatus Alkanophagales archaeon]
MLAKSFFSDLTILLGGRKVNIRRIQIVSGGAESAYLVSIDLLREDFPLYRKVVWTWRNPNPGKAIIHEKKAGMVTDVIDVPNIEADYIRLNKLGDVHLRGHLLVVNPSDTTEGDVVVELPVTVTPPPPKVVDVTIDLPGLSRGQGLLIGAGVGGIATAIPAYLLTKKPKYGLLGLLGVIVGGIIGYALSK